MEILNGFQKDVLQALAGEPLFSDYYLTGGTALSAFYLRHRYSEDLDFFTEVPQGVARAEGLVRGLARNLKLKIDFGRRFKTLFECSLINAAGERIEMDFALDMPGRLMPVRIKEALGVNLDNSLDIACNKLSALYERVESKDFVDVYFIAQELFSFQELWQKVRKKYGALNSYGLALAFSKVKAVEKLPRMVKPLKLDEIRAFFVEKADEVSKSLGC